MNDGRFYGLTGVDIAIDWLQERIKEQELFEGEADISIISANGTIAATSLADSLVGRKFQDEFPQARQQFDDLQDALEGEILDDEHLEVYVPILIGETQVPWQVHIKIPANLITAQATTTMWRSIWISSALLFFAFYHYLVLHQQAGSSIKTFDGLCKSHGRRRHFTGSIESS